MFRFLKDHPFAVESYLSSSLVLTFAVQKEELQKLVPDCLMPETYNDKWAFLAVAMVDTKSLRPKGFPGFLGTNFILVGYRIFVRYNSSYGRRLRGLYILRSETDKTRMAVLGSVFTRYNYFTTDLKYERHNGVVHFHSTKSHLSVKAELSEEDTRLPANSPFSNWNEARRFAGPLPFTFSFDPVRKEVLIVEGVRNAWKPKPVNVLECEVGFIDNMRSHTVVLASAFIIDSVPYYWKKGRKDKWMS